MKKLLLLTIILNIGFYSFAQNILELPQLEAINLDNKKLQVVTTTSIIADIVSNIAKNNIDLNSLIENGQNPHAFKLSARELSKLAQADLVFVNGWNLEENLNKSLANIADKVIIVPVSANIVPLKFNATEHNNADPHVWFSIDNVAQWAKNISEVLSSLDPEHSKDYANNLEQYLAELAALKAFAKQQIAQISTKKRILVSNHNSFAYFAKDYGFKTFTIIPSTSNLAEPSAKDLAKLISSLNENNVCTIFSEKDVSDKLAKLVASELDCANAAVYPLYTSSLAEQDNASSYIDSYKANLEKIVLGLK